LIKNIHLRNFESHKDTKLELSSGVNIISGKSDNGKSSIVRGIYWVHKNKPSGTSMVSFWNRDRNDKAVKPTFVILEMDNGIRIKRKRSGDFNGYELDETVLEAVGQTVPDAVLEKLNLSDVNVQYQFDKPFLLGDSGADVARFLNRIIHLELIDKIQSTAEILRRRTNQEIQESEHELQRMQAQIDSYSWIPSAKELLTQIYALETAIEADSTIYTTLQEMLTTYTKAQEKLSIAQTIEHSAVALVEKIDTLTEAIEEEIEEYDTLQSLYSTYQEQQHILTSAKKAQKAAKIVESIDELSDKIEQETQLYETLYDLYEKYIDMNETIKINTEKIHELEASLPDTCPYCGAQLKKGGAV